MQWKPNRSEGDIAASEARLYEERTVFFNGAVFALMRRIDRPMSVRTVIVPSVSRLEHAAHESDTSGL